MEQNIQQTIQKQKEQWEKLSDRVRAVLLGIAMGDGSVKVNKGYKNARMQFRHSIKQTEYFMWKRDIIRPEVSVDKANHPENKDTILQTVKGEKEKGTQKWRYCSQAHEALTYLNRLTYEGSRKVIKRSTLNMCTPLTMAIIWLDKGSLVAKGRQGVICTDAYTEEEVKKLGQYMKVEWGIETKAYIVKEGGKPKLKKDGTERWRLRLSTIEDLEKWIKLIMPYIEVKAMIRKILLRWPDAERQQRWISEIVKHTKFQREEVEEERRKIEERSEGTKAENDIVHSESSEEGESE